MTVMQHYLQYHIAMLRICKTFAGPSGNSQYNVQHCSIRVGYEIKPHSIAIPPDLWLICGMDVADNGLIIPWRETEGSVYGALCHWWQNNVDTVEVGIDSAITWYNILLYM